MKQKAIEILHEGIKQLEKSIIRLKASYSSCSKLRFSDEISDDQLKELESLSARFARSSDLFTHKVIKSLYVVLGEELLTLKDRLNFAEKLGIISSADQWMIIRSVRNQIVHDYIEEDLIAHHGQILDLCHVIIQDVTKLIGFVEQSNL